MPHPARPARRAPRCPATNGRASRPVPRSLAWSIPLGEKRSSTWPAARPCVRALRDSKITADDDPVALRSKPADPLHVGCIAREHVREMHDRIAVIAHESLNGPGEPRRQIVVKKEPHAARCSSKSSASRTDLTSVSNQRATCAVDPLASTARASTAVGMPRLAMIGWPNARCGSRTTHRRFPSGHHRTGSSEQNSIPRR